MVEIKEYLKYDPTSKTGLRWIKRAKYSKIREGSEAFTTVNGEGYYTGGVLGKRGLAAHQVIMFLEHGKWSDNDTNIHHKDGNKLNNNLNNLEFISKRNHKLIHSHIDWSPELKGKDLSKFII
jgi:hypothetical protein